MEKILYMATSLDGFISDENREEDFLSSYNWEKFVELAEDAGAFVVGRKTYETVRDWENHSYLDVNARRIVLSKQDSFAVDKGYEKFSSPREVLDSISEIDSLVLTGGAEVNYSFLDKEMIDRVILNIEPVLVGSGVSISSGTLNTNLKFVRMEREDNIVTVEYRTI